MSDSATTARACLEELTKLLPQSANLDALIGDAPIDGTARMVQVLEGLQLGPETVGETTPDELAAHFGSPVLLPLTNGNWVIFLGCRRGAEGEEDYFAVFDPLCEERSKVLFLKKAAMQKAWGGTAVFLRRFTNAQFAADGRHTLLYCLVSICRHHNIDADVRRLVHEYAVENEPGSDLLLKMADDLGLHGRRGRLTRKRLPDLEHSFPCIALTPEGKGVVICALRETPGEAGDAKEEAAPLQIAV